MKNLQLLQLLTCAALLTSHSLFTQDNRTSCGAVTIEGPAYTLEPQFRALFLKPGASNLHYAAQAQPFPLDNPDWNIFDLRPRYHFGFDIGLRVILPQCTNFDFNWEHFVSTTHAFHQVPVDTDMVGPFFEIGPDAAPYRNVASRVRFRFNTAHITGSLFMQAGPKLAANLFAGINVTALQQNLVSTFVGTSASNTPTPITRTISALTRFTGAGPEFGADLAFNVLEGFYITGRGAASILAGSARNHTTYVSTSPVLVTLGLPTPNIQHTFVNRRSIVVPELQTRIGIAYHFDLGDAAIINIEGGYDARVYFNAIQSTDMGSEVILVATRPAEVGVFARTFQRTVSNFSLSGFYIGFNVGF